MDDLPILEVDFRQDSAHLGTKLDAIDCRELANGPDPDVNIPLQRIADRDSRNRRRRRNRGLRRVIPGVGNPEAATQKDAENRKLPAQVPAIANLLARSDIDRGPKDDVAHGWPAVCWDEVSNEALFLEQLLL
jgi:hypothetical protein